MNALAEFSQGLTRQASFHGIRHIGRDDAALAPYRKKYLQKSIDFGIIKQRSVDEELHGQYA